MASVSGYGNTASPADQLATHRFAADPLATQILALVRSRLHQPWLIDNGDGNCKAQDDSESALDVAIAFEDYYQRLLDHCHSSTQPRLIIADANPVQFLAKFLAACAVGCPVFLGNAKWVTAEWQQAWAIAQPTHSLTPPLPHSLTPPLPLKPPPSNLKPQPSLPPHSIMIPTGGTSGQIRFAIHTWETLMASVEGFCQHFQIEQVNACCVLPFYHVSGLMQFLRSFTSGGTLVLPAFRNLEQAHPLPFNQTDYFLSLVPTQLARLCQTPAQLELLQPFKAILLGGAPPWPDLLATARQHQLPLAPTYGMTETASQVVTLRPTEFLAHPPQSPLVKGGRSSPPPFQGGVRGGNPTLIKGGRSGPPPWLSRSVSVGRRGVRGGNPTTDLFPIDCTESSIAELSTAPVSLHNRVGHVLPHAALTIRDPAGKALGVDQIGSITIQASSLALGYCTISGVVPIPREFQSNDVGRWDEQGQLQVVGRQQDMIISGGENIVPTEVESAIRATGLVKDVAVIGVSDRLWGEAVTAVYVPDHAQGDATSECIKMALGQRLNPIKRPKYWIPVTELPRNAQGKIQRSRLQDLALAQLH